LLILDLQFILVDLHRHENFNSSKKLQA